MSSNGPSLMGVRTARGVSVLIVSTAGAMFLPMWPSKARQFSVQRSFWAGCRSAGMPVGEGLSSGRRARPGGFRSSTRPGVVCDRGLH